MKEDDDDIQDYVERREQVYTKTLIQVTRNQTLEEVAREIEKMTAFGQDTIASFAVYIRNMKR